MNLMSSPASHHIAMLAYTGLLVTAGTLLQVTWSPGLLLALLGVNVLVILLLIFDLKYAHQNV